MTAAADAPDKTRRSLVTPEGVDLRLQLADAGQRAAGFLIDGAIILGVIIGLWITALVVDEATGVGGREYLAALLKLALFFLVNGYFIAFELRPGAATPGKRAMGVRVAARSGGRLTADAIFARNAVRNIEVMIPLSVFLSGGSLGGEAVAGWMYLAAVAWLGIFAFFPLFNRDRLRVGDMIAGTWVVVTPRRKLMPDLADDSAAHDRFGFTRQQVDAYGVKELHVLEEVLRQNDRKTMAAVAERIARKIGWTLDPATTERAFLTAYYGALRQRLEQRLLFGHRRKDKFDKA